MNIKSNNILLNKSLSLRNQNKIEKSFISSNDNNKISMYKNLFNTNIYKKLKAKTFKYKSIPLLYLTNIENKINNKIIHEYNSKNNLSTKSTSQNKLSSLYDSNITYLTNNDKIKSIIKEFEENKKSTKMLIDREKKMKLNSLNNISEENIVFLLSDGNYNNEENKKIRTINNKSNSHRLCWKLIKLFNKKTDNILNSSENNIQIFKKIKNKFNTTEIIDSFKRTQLSENDLKKLKQRYNEANEIIDEMNEEKTRRAKILEKEFYRLKNEEDSNKSEMRLRKILKKNTFSLSKNSKEFKRASVIKRLSIKPINIINHENKTDEKLSKAHMIYNEYFNKKIKLNAIAFGENIDRLINSKDNIKNCSYLDEQTKKMKMMSEDILIIKEINKIKKKNKEDAYIKNYAKLKEGMNECEDEYYRVCSFNNKNYNVSFLKPNLKKKTIKKCQRIQVCNFGIP